MEAPLIRGTIGRFRSLMHPTGVAKKVEVKQKKLKPDYDGNVEHATEAVEGKGLDKG